MFGKLGARTDLNDIDYNVPRIVMSSPVLYRAATEKTVATPEIHILASNACF